MVSNECKSKKCVCVGGWVFVLVNPYCTLGTKYNILVLVCNIGNPYPLADIFWSPWGKQLINHTQ